jgi:protein-tyrosine phosphatase
MQKFLFVCTGNACRSVMAQQLLARLGGPACEARSAGVAAEGYFQVPVGVRAALKAQGVPDFEHRPQLVTRELLAWADLVLVMERGHRELILDKFPEFRGRVHTLRGYLGRPAPEDVADPIGQADEVYAACCAEIKSCVEALLARDRA